VRGFVSLESIERGKAPYSAKSVIGSNIETLLTEFRSLSSVEAQVRRRKDWTSSIARFDGVIYGPEV